MRSCIVAAMLIVVTSLSGCGDGNGDGGGGSTQNVTFTDVDLGLPSYYLCSFAWGDSDQDGDLDFGLAGQVGAGASTSLYRNTAGTFAEDTVSTPPAVSDCAIAWGDHDGDNDLDLAVAGDDGTGTPLASRICINDGSGQLAGTGAALADLAGGCAVAWGDLDNDGDLDLALSGLDKNLNPVSKVYSSDGAGGFTDTTLTLEGVGAGCRVAWIDFDNDGDMDLAIAGQAKTAPVALIYENDGAGGLMPIAADLTGVGYGCAMAWADYDGDGDLDIALAGSAGYGAGGAPIRISKVYRNDGGAFSDIGAALIGVSDCALAWGDYDNDGDPDLALAGCVDADTSVTKIYRNDGGVFAEAGIAFPGVTCGPSLAWGDHDNDGDLDLAVVGYGGGGTYFGTVYESDGAPPNTSPLAPTGLSSSVSGGEVTFLWDAGTDTETATQALTYNLRIGTSAGSDDVMPGMSIIGGTLDGVRLVPSIGNVQHALSWTITGLTPGVTYHWSVQAVDSAFAGSPWAAEETVIP